MLGEPKLKILLDLVASSSKEELAWMNGYLSGLVNPAADGVPSPAALGGKLTIAYGTETGNSKRLATDLAARAKKKGIHPKVVSLDQYRLTDLAREEYFLTVISTQGEGEPPAAAKKFYDHIHKNGFRLDKLKYSVLALGDTSYPLFCKAGEDVDEQLLKLGGQRLVPLRKCDLDYESDAYSWFEEVLQNLGRPAAGSNPPGVAISPQKVTGKKSYTGTILSHINLNDRGSNKATYHIEILAEGLQYEPGDSAGIVPANPPAKVAALLAITGGEKGVAYRYREQDFTLTELFTRKLNISHLTERVLQRFSSLTGHEIKNPVADLEELLNHYPLKDPGQLGELIGLLNPIAPRLYTVASSPLAHPGELHLTVARDQFMAGGHLRNGVCSEYLGALAEQTELSFFIQKNKRFKLPALHKDIIMIGPGTGIAAFRSFIAERDAQGATGRNWLFFGEQHFATDFLYQTEIQAWQETGVLTRVNVAFSRDQPQKIYVQHKMAQQAAELFSWIQSGAYIYLCGAKEPMSVEVEATLLQVIEQQGGQNREEAIGYLAGLEEEGRYSKDVY